MKSTIPGRLGMLALMSIALAANSNLTGARAQVAFSANVQVQTVSDFYGPLASYGTWYNVPAYGRCWHPAEVATVWRPYTVGDWEWTDCGWYWVSDEPWAWACYHYGSWVYDPVYGWVWVPGTEWAPAWVVWRESPEDDYIGWAPCGPSGGAVTPSLFVFVHSQHFRDHLRPERLIVNNTALINRTRVINNISQETRTFNGRRERIAVNPGPGIDPIQRATGAPIAARPIEQVVAKTANPAVPRREGAPEVTQSPRQTTQSPAAPVSRQEQPQHIYRQPATPPAPTGRQEPRLYHEPNPAVPQASPSVPPGRRTPTEPAAPNQVPPVSVPERAPSPGSSERGDRTFQGNPDARNVAPTPAPATPGVHQVPPPSPERGRDKERDRE